MAVTKIWAIKDSLSRVVDYAANPSKTIYSDLQKVIHYAENENKTANEDEKICYVTGVNCNTKTAFDEMISVQKRYNKCTGNVAYHAYQSFKTGEVTPEQCHRIGVELAKNMYENLVNQLAEQEGITEQLKATDMLAWVQAMNNIANRAREIVCNEIINNI